MNLLEVFKMVRVTVNKQPEKEFKFPMLMESSTGNIVLMTSQSGANGVGVAVAGYYAGTYSTSWTMHNFKPFIGSITLEND